MIRACGFIAVAAGLLTAARVGLSQSAPDLPQPRSVANGSGQTPHQYTGALSCASAACHNQSLGGPGGVVGNEYAIWATRDPHTRAFQVLYNERSKVIEQNLRGKRGQSPHPERDRLCLRCHALPNLDAMTDLDSSRVQNLLRDGVGCEGCHGAAEVWRTRHYQAGWSGLSPAEKAEIGFNDTKDLVARGRACADCHIGNGSRDVNHDLIAAGHPRLAFEYSAFLAVLPRHWSLAAERQRYPDLEARTWVLGQAISAQAMLELLADRAKPADKKPWPELAEYDCFSCHHDLTKAGWREQREAKSQSHATLGYPPWQEWYTAVLRQALGQPDAVPALKKLHGEMRKPEPDRTEVGALARQAAEELNAQLPILSARRYDDPAWLQSQLKRLAGRHDLASCSWDSAAQLYLALAAVYQAEATQVSGFGEGPIRGSLTEMRRLLRFPQGPDVRRDSPEERQVPRRQQQLLRTLDQLQRELGR